MWATETWFLLWETCCWCDQLTSLLKGIGLSGLGSSAVTNSLEVPTYPGQAYLLSGGIGGPEKHDDTPASILFWSHISLQSTCLLCQLLNILLTPSQPSNSQNTTETQQWVLDTVSRSYKALKEVTTVKPRSTILNIYFARFNSVLSNIPGTQCILISPDFNLSKTIIRKKNMITQMVQAVGGGESQHKSLSKAPSVYLL